MKKGRLFKTIPFVLATVILFSLLQSSRGTVSAATCTWTGNTNTSWTTTSNWSCGHVPTGADDVVIPNVTNDPLIDARLDVYANNITIQAGTLIIVSEQLTIYASNVDNYGTIKTIGMDSTYVQVYSPFNNYGVLESYCGGFINLHQGGDHTGTFTGEYGSILFRGEGVHNTTFTSDAKIFVRKVTFAFSPAPVTVPATVTQQFYGSMFQVDFSDVTLTNLTNLQLGEVYIMDGSLTITASGTTTGAVTIPNGANLTGAGTITGDVSNSGIISPGTSPGVINVNGDFEQSDEGKLSIELGGTTAGTDYDQLLITGAATLDGDLEVTLIDAFEPALGDSFNIMTFASHSDEFATSTLPDLAVGLAWEVNTSATGVTLDVIRSGSISGTVTYTGTKGSNPIAVALFLDYEDAPDYVTNVGSATTEYDYSFEGIPTGNYYLAALMDLNNSNDPDPGEPYSFFDADANDVPDLIEVTESTWVYSDVDFELTDPSGFLFFLPMIIN